MRIVDTNEIPNPQSGRSAYPWDEICSAIDAGKAVEMDPTDYPSVKDARSLGSSIYAYMYRNGLKWQIHIRDGLVYVSQRQP